MSHSDGSNEGLVFMASEVAQEVTQGDSIIISAQKQHEPAGEDLALCSRLLQQPNLVGSRLYLLKTYEDVIVGREVVDYMMQTGLASTREQCVRKGRSLVEAGLIYHVTFDHDFQDKVSN
jgi:hypothetical protein